MIGHAQAITENGAACDSAGGIDGGYGDLETSVIALGDAIGREPVVTPSGAL